MVHKGLLTLLKMKKIAKDVLNTIVYFWTWKKKKQIK